MARNINIIDISAPFFEVARIYRSKRRIVYLGNDVLRAQDIYDRERARIRCGDLVAYTDGFKVAGTHCGYNRTRW